MKAAEMRILRDGCFVWLSRIKLGIRKKNDNRDKH